MSLSIAHLRDDFKVHLEQWTGDVAQESQINPMLLTEVRNWSIKIEKFIQEKIRLLEMDFNHYELKDEYLRSVSEGFSDLERIMSTEKTLIDAIEHQELVKIPEQIKHFYMHYFVPLFNILSKLENDYIAITTDAILTNSKKVSEIELKIKALKTEKRSVKNRILSFVRINMFEEISRNITELELQRKLLRLTMQHDKLNLYYFNHERPSELKAIKEKADSLRAELRQALGAKHEIIK